LPQRRLIRCFFAADTLKSWIAEADGSSDTVSACVAHAYLALLWSNISSSEFTPEIVRGHGCYAPKPSVEPFSSALFHF
jgi:hypothetical protein